MTINDQAFAKLADWFEENSSGYDMGFLKEEYQIVIEYIKVID